MNNAKRMKTKNGDDFMTLVPVFKKCPICKKKYSWNPGIGKMWCPDCGPMSAPGAGDIPWKKDERKNSFDSRKNKRTE